MMQPEHDQHPTLPQPTDDDAAALGILADDNRQAGVWADSYLEGTAAALGQNPEEKSTQRIAPNPDDVRLQEFNLAIELHPASAVNYLLRGEWFLAKNQVYIAKDDFQKAAQLAAAQLAASAWGFTDQWVRDRALAYLEDLEL